jgi:linoleoyl-CoA desaturase
MGKSAIIEKKPAARSLRFTQRRNFQKTLNERVDAYLKENHIPARDLPAMYLKTAFMMAWWLVIYLLLLFGEFSPLANLFLLVVWAMAIAGIGFNVMHDANHGGYSNKPIVNKIVGLSAEMLGMSGFRWRTKHNVWHHTYTNIAGYDDDVETFGTMRLTPRAPWKPLYRAQAWYFPIVYGFIAFDFFVRDFMMAISGKSDSNHVYPKMTTEDKITFWVGKLVFVILMFVIPMQGYPWWQVVLAFVIVIFILGLILGVIFQLAHINSAATFPEPVGSPQHIENEWAIHQVETTADFGQGNRLLSFYIGGLNFQIEHHLMPHICHLNYPRLAPIVRATCEEFGVRYTAYPTWREALACHLSELQFLAQPSASEQVS